jgi:hypothetical protein
MVMAPVLPQTNCKVVVTFVSKKMSDKLQFVAATRQAKSLSDIKLAQCRLQSLLATIADFR